MKEPDDFLVPEMHSPLEIAEQLTLMDMEEYIKIEPRELISQKERSNSVNLKSIISTFESRSKWIIHEVIFGIGDAHGRAQRITFCIEIAGEESCLMTRKQSLYSIFSS